ncbi:hypothetical protein M422DRAFT_255876 [Sphaerobolus stellatus SS14]|uniref:F-box domain-containing protein n=1 Tax=Sphaerobolus stellatus (strain SS14) TaxID=990650 RepID=A0A0C9VSI9_SPHS4|nr:hypothetical protein M422DRAFT_255876 [Sphaerobolus stellatus SS14]
MSNQGQKHSDERRCFLLSLPSESLTHITTYVDDPRSLIALSRTNHRLSDHVAEDNTWYRAFAFHFWGLGPESEPKYETKVMLRKTENTWKKEFVKRSEILHRWEKSRSSTLNYQPQYCNITSLSLLDNMSLMTSNLQYGIVGRSFPLTGKIFKGYYDASGTANGMGIGNPNEEFTPNVSSIALSSNGGTGRIAWGFRSGQVANTFAPRLMESTKSAARFTRCRFEDEHRGAVQCIQFAGRDDDLIISGCDHGQVKFWDTKRMRCLWTGSGMKEDTLLPDACVKLQFIPGSNVVVAALRNGDIMIWWGFQFNADGTSGQTLQGDIQNARIPQSIESKNDLDTMFVDPNSTSSKVILLLHHDTEVTFTRLVIELPSGDVTSTIFCEGPVGPLTAFKPCFVSQPIPSTPVSVPATPIVPGATSLSITMASDIVLFKPSSFILAGDTLGRVCVWPWDVEGTSEISPNGTLVPRVKSIRRWEAHDDGAVCVIETNGIIIVTGSTRGTVKVWDALTFAPIRSFASPTTKPSAINGQWDPVGHIIVRDDLLLATVGSRVLTWHATPVSSDRKNKAKRVGKPKGRSNVVINKWQQQIEMNNDIRESKRAIQDERAHSQRVNGRLRAQQSTLDGLGLTEAEAVEYLLMLSREEDERRRVSELAGSQAIAESSTSQAIAGSSGQAIAEYSDRAVAGSSGDGHVENDDDIFDFEDYNEFRLSRSPSSQPSINASPSSRPLPRTIPTNSNEKVQLSRSFNSDRSVPGSAGLRRDVTAPLAMSPSASGMVSAASTPASSFNDPEAFPSMSPTSSISIGRSVSSSVRLAGSWSRGTPPMSLSTPSPAASSPARRAVEEEEDDVLRFVLELSLAEARSRGEA